jgi:hypothetical protein
MFGSFNYSPFLCGMEINITTEIKKNDYGTWDIIISENGKYITTTLVRTKTQATQLSKSKKRLMEQIKIGKIFHETNMNGGVDADLPF